jgi:hypothetical protein
MWHIFAVGRAVRLTRVNGSSPVPWFRQQRIDANHRFGETDAVTTNGRLPPGRQMKDCFAAHVERRAFICRGAVAAEG